MGVCLFNKVSFVFKVPKPPQRLQILTLWPPTFRNRSAATVTTTGNHELTQFIITTVIANILLRFYFTILYVIPTMCGVSTFCTSVHLKAIIRWQICVSLWFQRSCHDALAAVLLSLGGGFCLSATAPSAQTAKRKWVSSPLSPVLTSTEWVQRTTTVLSAPAPTASSLVRADGFH